MYTVNVRWGDVVKTHKAWTLASAKAWLYKYPKGDFFGSVTDIFGRRVAVRYYR